VGCVLSRCVYPSLTMNVTLIDALWNSLKTGEAKSLAALAAEAGDFLHAPVNKFRIETELLNLVREKKLARIGEAYGAIPGKPLVKEQPVPVPKLRVPRKAKAGRKIESEAPEPGQPDPAVELDDPSKEFIRGNVLKLGSRYAAERFYQEDCPVDRYAQQQAAKVFAEEPPSKYRRRRRIPRKRPAASSPAPAEPAPPVDIPASA
jgi:hypothetical protein